MLKAEILSQGDEVITGQTVDSNAAWLSEQLTLIGMQVQRHTTVGDNVDAIAAIVADAADRCDLLLCSGGLGPTADDLTAEAVALAAGVPLRFDAEAMAQIERLYRRFGKTMADSNRKQAMLPQGCLRLDNRWGTAPGFALQLGRAWLAFMPGVPREMKKMFAARVVPELQARFALSPGHLITLRTVGAGESRLQQLLGDWRHPEVTLGYRVMAPEVQVKLRFAPGFPVDERNKLGRGVAQRIGDAVFSREGLDGIGSDAPGDLSSVTLRLLHDQGVGVTVAEQGVDGALVAMLLGSGGATGPGCHRVFGPDAAVSRQHTVALAQQARGSVSDGMGLALMLQSDPDGAHPGSAWVALAGADGVTERSFTVAGGRALMQTLAAGAAIDFLRRRLLALGGVAGW